MKQLALSLLLLFASAFASANSVGFSNAGGTLNGGTSGLSLSGSVLAGIITNTQITGNLGSVAFSTGALVTGSLANGGIFAKGGTFTITGNGSQGIENGAIFSGTFAGPVNWLAVTLANGTHNYILSGTLSGVWWSGQTVNGTTVSLSFNTGKGLFKGSVGLAIGGTDIVGNGLGVSPVPEPGALLYMGVGLAAIAGVLRKFRAEGQAA